MQPQHCQLHGAGWQPVGVTAGAWWALGNLLTLYLPTDWQRALIDCIDSASVPRLPLVCEHTTPFEWLEKMVRKRFL